jgi:hypothetical protein
MTSPCSGQGMPNCVGWSPLETGSKKWGYRTAVNVPDGRLLTPQQAFGAYYRGDTAAAVAVDKHPFFNNPTCIYLGHPAPEPPPPPTPPPPNCSDFSGPWVDPPSQPTPLELTQSECSGSYVDGSGATVTFVAAGKNPATITTSKADHGGRTGVMKSSSSGDTITWSDGDTWQRSCANFEGNWIDNPHWFTPVHFTQSGCKGSFAEGGTSVTFVGPTCLDSDLRSSVVDCVLLAIQS